jgi:hypothetical protein
MPMLIMESLSSHAKAAIYLRLHILRPLLSEVVNYLQNSLTAGVQLIAISMQPFNREVDLDSSRIQIMEHFRMHCQLIQAVQVSKPSYHQVVSPEHRLSLQLKPFDQNDSDQLIKFVEDANSSYEDVFDESDALLHHRYELVYAVGNPGLLDQAVLRSIVMQSILCLLNTRGTKAFVIIRELASNRSQDSHPGIYELILLSNLSPDDSKRLNEAIIDGLEEVKLEGLCWITELSAEDRRLVRRLATDCEMKDFRGSTIVSGEYLDKVLMIRGLLTSGLLQHCLSQRHRVTYGVSSRMKLAIPFRAADFPSDRSEFSHPDVCILVSRFLTYILVDHSFLLPNWAVTQASKNCY